jgi:excisionase family DNA binding protein
MSEVGGSPRSSPAPSSRTSEGGALPSSLAPTAHTSAAHTEHECLTVDEVAKLLRLNRKTVYEAAARQQIPCRRLGRKFLFSKSAVLGWLARSPPGNSR